MDIYSRLINRENPLPKDFVPEDLVSCEFPFLAAGSEEKRLLCSAAAESARRLIEYGKSFGCHLAGISGYRSYARQQEIYETRLRGSRTGARLTLPCSSWRQRTPEWSGSGCFLSLRTYGA